MLKRYSYIINHKFTFIFTSVCLLISLSLILLSRFTGGFAQWYAVKIYPFVLDFVGRFFSAWDFSFFEVGIAVIILFTAAFILAAILLLLFRSRVRRAFFSFCLRIMVCFMAVLVLMYSLSAVNYQRESIGAVLNLPVTDMSEEKLEKLNILLADDIEKITSDPGWESSLLSANDFTYVETEAVAGMKEMGKTEPSLSGYYPKPKPVYFSEMLSRLGIEGIYSPFTMEANYNDNMTAFLIPYTISHELAHLKGYMKEDDAGFIAFMACINSPSLVFQYSGLFHALIFSLSALKDEVSTEEFNRVYEQLPENIRLQLDYVEEQNQEYDSPLMAFAARINNLYLLANAQMGTKSYGHMVDFLIAEYSDRINTGNLV